jgi:hypothetical protein
MGFSFGIIQFDFSGDLKKNNLQFGWLFNIQVGGAVDRS